MLRLDSELYEHLRTGGTLVVVSRQRAAAVQLAYAQARLAAGDSTWATPEVLSLPALLERARAQSRRPQDKRQLTASEEWALWRSAAFDTTGTAQLLSVGALTDDLQANHALLAEWGLEQQVLATPEGEWLRRAAGRYRQRLASLAATDSQAWQQECAALNGEVLLAHADSCGVALRESLLARGARLYQAAEADRASASVVVASNGDAEFELMASWARRQLEREPASRLLLIVADLSVEISQVQRFLDEQLEGTTIAAPAGELATYAIEGGVPLAASPLIQVALRAIRLAAMKRPFADWAFLLRSSCLAEETAASRLQLEQLAREHGLTTADWQDLAALARAQFITASAWLEQLAESIHRWPTAAAPSRWARLFVELWAQLGWPGERSLSGADVQRRARVDELLGEFASLDDVLPSLDGSAATDLLQHWIGNARFEPASGDVPVTVTAQLDDPLVHYDAIWVARLTAERWPRPAESSGFVASAALHAAGHLRASADGQLALAQRCMQQWSRRAGQLIYSWARADGEARSIASPLLAGLPVLELQAESAGPRSGLLQVATALEDCGADVALRWTGPGTRRGGVALLQSQSHCPFQASARWRLGCEALQVPVAGVDPRLHGEIVHGALRQLWSELEGSAALRARPAAEWNLLAANAVSQAVAAARAGKGRLVDALAWAVEERRCTQLLLAALQLESGRPAFRVAAAEQTQVLRLGALELRLRLDRVDRLVDESAPGTVSQLLIDYKTGRREITDFESMRPKQVQLQTYAQLVDGLRAAVAMHLHRGTAQWAGVADEPGRLDRVKAAAGGWQELQLRWRAMLHLLAEQFVSGVATVDPLKSACQYCELQLLCRVDAEVLAESLAGTESEDA